MTRRTLIAAPALYFGKASANEKITIACMGVRGRAGHLVRGFAAMPDIDIATLIDVDENQFAKAVTDVTAAKGKAPRTERDFRRVLDDKSIDALVVGTPDHWHAIPTILACQAGKHVYVEKPCSHNVREGQVMLEAARKHGRVVQVGIQSRSGRHFAEALEYIRSGALGKVAFARGWETARQKSIGRPPDSDPPAGVDYDMWLGPAPKRPFNPMRFHSNWRWFFDYGTGDLGNDGVHRIDYARRALEAAFTGMGKRLPDWPTAVSAAGGKHYFDDAQEFPDNLMVNWEYPGAILNYEMRIWTGSKMEGEEEGGAVYGDQGHVVIGNTGWRAFGPKGEPLPHGTQSGNDQHDPAHKRDFTDAIRNRRRPNCDIAIGHVASSMTHLGNIAWRMDRKLKFDGVAERFIGDDEANKLLSRTYRAPWSLPKV
ncbi:MAG: Gfo/Idh/MocA family oxidoreductase [Acidobacteria bacterium]|nr:Gfo/Idh/MocA family oxidoreductase [Acidobacteriota bacterium]